MKSQHHPWSHAGEYIVDSFGGSLLLLVYPPPPSTDGGGAQNKPVLSLNETDLVHISDTHGVSFDGIDIAYGKGWGAVFENCEGCSISNAFVGNTVPNPCRTLLLSCTPLLLSRML